MKREKYNNEGLIENIIKVDNEFENGINQVKKLYEEDLKIDTSILPSRIPSIIVNDNKGYNKILSNKEILEPQLNKAVDMLRNAKEQYKNKIINKQPIIRNVFNNISNIDGETMVDKLNKVEETERNKKEVINNLKIKTNQNKEIKKMSNADKESREIDKKSIEYHKAYILKTIPKSQPKSSSSSSSSLKPLKQDEEKDDEAIEEQSFEKEQNDLMNSYDVEFKDYTEPQLKEIVLNILDVFGKTFTNSERMTKPHKDILNKALKGLKITTNNRNLKTIRDIINAKELQTSIEPKISRKKNK